MVMSRPKSKVYFRFIKLLEIFLQKDCHIRNYCFFYRARCSKSSMAKNRNPEYTAKATFLFFSVLRPRAGRF